MEEQFALGDGVEISGVSGSVEKISMRTVRVRGLDGTLHTIPNGSIGRVSNKTYQWSRAVVKVGVSYDADPPKVLEVLNRVALGMYEDEEWKDNFLEEPSAQGILSFGDSAIDFRVLAKTTPGGQWGLSREMMIRIKKAFDEEGIDIPYNYVNVNLVDQSKSTA
jgi:small conductance mechanosensitive channel